MYCFCKGYVVNVYVLRRTTRRKTLSIVSLVKYIFIKADGDLLNAVSQE